MNTENIFKLIEKLILETSNSKLQWSLFSEDGEYKLDFKTEYILVGKNDDKYIEIEVDDYPDKNYYYKEYEKNEDYYIKIINNDGILIDFFSENSLYDNVKGIKVVTYESSLKKLYELIQYKYSIKTINGILTEIDGIK